MSINWTLKSIKLKDLKKHPKNPRRLTSIQAAQLTKSLDSFGMIEKIIINQDMIIIGGHQRFSILKKQGIKELECWYPDRLLEEKEVEELLLRLNKNHEEWDFEILANEFDIPDLLDYGFSPEDLDIGNFETVENETEEDSEVLEPCKDEDAITKLGDIIELNEHRLVCGDSTLPEYVQKCLNGAEPILMVTDPPYGVDYDPDWQKRKATPRKGKLTLGKVQNDTQVNWSLAWHLFPGSIAYVWHAAKSCAEVEKSLTDCDYQIISQIIWVKQNFAISRGDYHWKHEPCWYAIKKDHSHNWQGSRKECTVWEIANLNAFGGNKEEREERTAHSTQKPIECMAKPIRNNTAQGEGVYDPFLGSGTTLIAAEKLGRICYGIELSPAYCDIIIERWKKFMEKSGKEFTIKRNGEVL